MADEESDVSKKDDALEDGEVPDKIEGVDGEVPDETKGVDVSRR